MNISKGSWENYRETQKKIRKKANQEMVKWIDTNGYQDREALIDYANALVDKYGSAAATYASELYDEIALLQGARVLPAMPAEVATFNEVAKAVNGSLLQSESGQLVASVVERFTKQADADTLIRNAKRDKAQWAWIPSGDTCAFCITLASRGWHDASSAVMDGNHASHIHANCDCEFCIRFDKKSNVEGYEPSKYYDEYINAAKGNSSAKINAMRRENYAKNKELINSQHREAYKIRVENRED